MPAEPQLGVPGGLSASFPKAMRALEDAGVLLNNKQLSNLLLDSGLYNDTRSFLGKLFTPLSKNILDQFKADQGIVNDGSATGLKILQNAVLNTITSKPSITCVPEEGTIVVDSGTGMVTVNSGTTCPTTATNKTAITGQATVGTIEPTISIDSTAGTVTIDTEGGDNREKACSWASDRCCKGGSGTGGCACFGDPDNAGLQSDGTCKYSGPKF